MLFIILTLLSLLQYNCYAIQILEGKEEGVSTASMEEGAALMYMSKGHPLIVLKWCLQVGAEVGMLLLEQGEGNFSWEEGGVY